MPMVLIDAQNFANYPPPDLGKYRLAASRTADSAPAQWYNYKQMTGEEWDGNWAQRYSCTRQ